MSSPHNVTDCFEADHPPACVDCGQCFPCSEARTAADTALLEACREHIVELEEAWIRGAIVEHDGKGGTRSNRNIALHIRLDERLEEK